MIKTSIAVEKWPPEPHQVSFSDRSHNLLMRDRESAYRDRTVEVGANIGDFLGGTMIEEAAYEIADKLSVDLSRDPEQTEAFIRGVSSTLPGYIEHRESQAVQAEGLEAISIMRAHEERGAAS